MRLNVLTKSDLVSGLSELGLESGMSVMVHSSMSSLGYVVNGAVDVIDAILYCIGERGTLVVPTHTGQLTDPSDWENPAIEEKSINKVRDNMSPFNKILTMPRNRGIVPQTLLHYSKVYRSNHPLNSVAAVGRYAQKITAIHSLHESEGINSPIGVLHALGGSVLLIGVTMSSCTAVHLAEFLADVPYLRDNQVKVLHRDNSGVASFIRLKKYPGESTYFDKLIPKMSAVGELKEGKIGRSKVLLFQIPPLIKLALRYLDYDPTYLVTP